MGSKRRPPALAVALLRVVGLVLSVGAASAALAAGPDPRRVAAVAAMLAERPAAFGRPITDRAAWEALAKHKAYHSVVRRAEPYLTQPLPELPDELFLDFSRTGNRTRWQRVASLRGRRLSPLVLAECIENKGRFLPALDTLIAALCAQKTWVMPAHDRSLANFHGKSIDIDLRAASMAWDLATADWLLADRLKPATRTLLRDNIRRRVLDPYRDMALGKRKANWWTRTTSNWNAVCLAGVTGAGLAQLGSREERAFFVVAAEGYSRNFLRGFPPDGYCTEGLGYWNYGFGHFLLLAEAVHQATGGGVDLLARDEARPAATFGARIEIQELVYPAFADCSVRARPSWQAMAFISRRYRLGLERWERDTISPGGSLYGAMMYSFANSATRTPPAPEPALAVGARSWFDKAAILLCRPGPHAACRLAVALKGGHNAEHHNHNDVGSYVAVVGDDPVLLDPGGEVYTARTFSRQRYVSKVLNSFGHPVPMVAGQLQQRGRKAAARVVRTEFTDDADTLVLDIASAYKVPGLKKLVRTFRYSRQGAGSLTVTDEVAFAEPKAFGTALVTLGRWERLGPQAIAVYGLTEAVRVDIDAGGRKIVLRAEVLKEDVRTPSPPTRIGIDLEAPAAEAAITLTIAPLAVPGEEGRLLRNGGFERGAWAWTIPKGGMGSLSTERAASGKASLRIVDTEKKVGSNIHSARMRVAGREFELRGKVLTVSGGGVGLYVKCYDAEQQLLNETDHRGWISSVTSVGAPGGAWQPFAVRFAVPEGTVWLRLWIHSSTGTLVDACLDDLEIAPVAAP